MIQLEMNEKQKQENDAVYATAEMANLHSSNGSAKSNIQGKGQH